MWILGLACLPVFAAAVAAAFSSDVSDALDRTTKLYVATQRKDGSRSKVSPIWFMRDGDALYFTTVPTSYKAKRVKLGRPLHVHVGRRGGPYFKGRGEVLHDPELAGRMGEAYAERYWLAWLGFFRPDPDAIRSGESVIVRVVPWDEASTP